MIDLNGIRSNNLKNKKKNQLNRVFHKIPHKTNPYLYNQVSMSVNCYISIDIICSQTKIL